MRPVIQRMIANITNHAPGSRGGVRHGNIIGDEGDSRGREELNGISGCNLALEVLQQRLSIDESDGGDLLSAGDLDVLSVL